MEPNKKLIQLILITNLTSLELILTSINPILALVMLGCKVYDLYDDEIIEYFNG